MKQNIKIFFIALVLGGLATYLVCYKLDTPIISNALDSKVTYFYVGSYNNLEDANNKKNKYPSSIIHEEEGIYRVIIGIYNKKECIELMESYFLDQGITFRKKEMKIGSEYLKLISNYELLITTSDKTYYNNLNNSILKLFYEYLNT